MKAKKPTRADRLAWAKLHGYHGDTQAFTRLIVESRIARPALDAAWREGVQAKRNGVRCTCHSCTKAAML